MTQQASWDYILRLERSLRDSRGETEEMRLKWQEATVDAARLVGDRSDLIDAVETLLRSACPHPTDHPSMTAAWQSAADLGGEKNHAQVLARAAIAKALPTPNESTPSSCAIGSTGERR